MKNHEKRTNNLINIYFYPCKKHKYIIINNLGKITIESRTKARKIPLIT